MPTLVRVLLLLLGAINLVGFCVAGIDKWKANKKRWRVPEKNFFILCILGACPGVYAGLLLFRHKTRHWYFMWGIPAIFVIQMVLVLNVM